MIRPALLVLLLCLPGSSPRAEAQAIKNRTSEVDPLIGTGNLNGDGGRTWPGATRPFGMLNWSPDPPTGFEYRFEHPVTRGFSLTHMNGVGCSVFGDLPIMPVAGKLSANPVLRGTAYVAHFSHEDEHAAPGAYDVTLDSGVAVHLTASVHSGIGVFSFPKESEGTVILDLSRGFGQVTETDIRIDGREISGSLSSCGWCGMENRYRLYFDMEVDQTPADSGTFDDVGIQRSAQARTGRAGGYLTFAAGVRPVKLRVGLSYVSVEKARANLAAEIPDWNQDRIRNEASAAWNSMLDRVSVEGGTPEQRRVFYTALYHVFLQPSIFSDVDGEYLGFDDRPHHVEPGHTRYANFSGWDIYRSQSQLLALLAPAVASDIGRTFLADAAEGGGGLPKWTVANDESNVMVGDPGPIILANFWAFGARGFDGNAALAAMLASAEDPNTHLRLYRSRPNLQDYLSKGYVFLKPFDQEDRNTTANDGSASITLEYNAADFATARMAEALGKHDVAEKMLARAGSWRTLFNPETGFIEARDASGKFLPNFTPGKSNGFVEGNSAQYTWMVLHDLAGLRTAMGGAEKMGRRLDTYFGPSIAPLEGETPAYFNLNNEPSFGDPWIYNWAGQPWRTQLVVRDTLKTLFTAAPNGLPGNDDMGAMSAWIVFAQLGIFPAIPGEGGFTLNTPTFTRADVRIGSRVVRLSTQGSGPYIASVKLNGKPIDRWWLTWDQLATSTSLTFDLTPSAQSAIHLDEPPSFPPPAD